MFAVGYARFLNGEPGPSYATTYEDRLYEDIVLPQKLGERVYMRYRFRYEQRWIEDQDFRTRYRYAIFMDVPLNMTTLKKGAWYLAFYNELFLNGQRNIGNGQTVEIFDRNGLCGAVGYSFSDTVRLQIGYLYQYADDFSNGQIQLGVHQVF